jgi:hypothetical protein
LEAMRHGTEGDDAVAGAVETLAPTVVPEETPAIQVDASSLEIDAAPQLPEVGADIADELDRVRGATARAATDREIAAAQELLAQHEATVQADRAEAVIAAHDEGTQAVVEQQTARDEARANVVQEQAQLRAENASAIGEYRRAAEGQYGAITSQVRASTPDDSKNEATDANQRETGDTSLVDRISQGVAKGAAIVRDAAAEAYDFVKSLIARVAPRIHELLRIAAAALKVIVARAYANMLERLRAAQQKLNTIIGRLSARIADLVKRLSVRLSALLRKLQARLEQIMSAIFSAFQEACAWAEKVRLVLAALADGALEAVIQIIKDPQATLERARGAFGQLVAATPAKIEEVYRQHLAPIIESAPNAKADMRPTAIAPAGTDQLSEAGDAAMQETHPEGVWRHLKVRGEYFRDHWWEVLLDAALEILVPGVALYRHLPLIWEAAKEGWRAAAAGDISRVVDAVLTVQREYMAILTSFIAQVSIIAFIAGSVFGTPIVGAAALEAIGLATILADGALQIATIAKSASNFDDVDADEKRLETDYGRVADSSVALAVMLALVALGAIACKTASALVRRFPALGRAAEALKHKLRRGLGLKAKRPPKMESKLKPLDAVPPEAIDLPIRNSLQPHERIAFDRWVAERRAKGVDVAKALQGKNVEQVRKMISKDLAWAADQEARRAHNLKWEGEMLDPKMANGPVQQGGADVWARWNDVPPAEIGEGVRLNARTGERIDLFGDTFPGIDGTIGRPPRPLQLKHVPQSEAISNIPRVAEDALTKAREHGFSRLEVSIEAPGRTVAEVRDAFARHPSKFTDSVSVSRVRIWCKDGVYEPTSFKPVIPPSHPKAPPEQSGKDDE